MEKVSVIIPNYNHARYLRQRIESVLRQTYQNTEIFILDDCSTDSSLEVIEDYRSSKIALHTNQRNSGSTFKQWNLGFSLARGKYIWIAESDDFSEPDFLETLVVRMEANPRANLAYSQSMVVDENGKEMFSFQKETNFVNRSHWSADYSNNGADERARYLSVANTIPNASAVLTRRTAIDRVGGADTGYRLAGDWLFWLRILEEGDVEFVSKPLNYFRRHQNTVRASQDAELGRILEFYKITEYILSTCDLSLKQKARVKYLMLRYWCEWSERADIDQRISGQKQILGLAGRVHWLPGLQMRMFSAARTIKKRIGKSNPV